MYQTLVLVHVLSAILGVGPTFFGHVLFRKEQSLAELRNSLMMFKRLEIFPKIGGTLAVITGLILYYMGSWGTFVQLWLLGTLILYIAIQILMIGFVGPLSKKLGTYLSDPTTSKLDALPAKYQKTFSKINKIFWTVSTMGVLIFVLMILKPAGL
ncbi:DUF2269 family protein [Aquisalibacillus elongatus]|uniref:Putative integral membrane protein DUF2269 n=1 Tax=Aquisalibacillus elongatus TaxID=485577 RepID=A0A3N5C587_9BACI|nr:DUF2269 family protein [Aquisalibacillus elongatus]RPF53335.1 putative integral membrane protein DUF2269 [Aquisalibacillus elongatus]